MISGIKKNDGSVTTDQNEIIDVIHSFYKDLWEHDIVINESAQDSFLNDVQCMSGEDMDEQISPFVNVQDAEEALSVQYKMDSSPGPDGLTYNHYRSNWNTLKEDLVQVYNNAYIMQRLPDSMNESIIKLVPKKGDLADIKNWRPVSLLNVDYKILSRIIFNKIVHFLNKRTSHNQKSIFPGRNIMDIHLNTSCAIQFSKEHRKCNAAIVKLDLEKAFDRVNHKFMFKVLQKLKLSKNMIKWIEILYSNPSCQIEVNGALSPLIRILRGIRQGCPLSMLLFGIVLEALIQKINMNDEGLNGIKFGRDTQLKLQVCADDLTVYISDKRSLEIVMNQIRLFGLNSGQRVNDDKTQIILKGDYIKEEIRRSIYQKYVSEKIKILGIYYSFKSEDLKENYIKIIKKIKNDLEIQKTRNLTMYGKIQILNTKIIPLVFQRMQCLSIEHKYIKEIENLIFSFLWHPQGREMIDKNNLIAEYDKGGIKMIDIWSKFKAAKIYKLKSIATAQNKKEFWIKFAFYNIGSTLRTLNQSLFNNAEPHRTIPHDYWEQVKNTYREVIALQPNIDMQTVKFKNIYQIFKDAHCSSSNTEINWNDVHLIKGKKYVFTNKERETSYFIAQDAIDCGQRRRASDLFIDIPTWQTNNCKFCNNHEDNVDHLFTGKCVTLKNIFDSCKSLYWMTTKERLILDRKLMLYNKVDNWEKDYMKVKLCVIAKKVILIEKQKLDKYKTFVKNKDSFISNIVQEITHLFMNSLKDNAVFIKPFHSNEQVWQVL